MIKLGEIQNLYVKEMKPMGVYLSDLDNEYEKVLLPLKQVPEDVDLGDEIEVFVYRDSNDRKIATTKKPYLTLNDVAELKVVEATKIGAFMDWGLEKDLFLPFKEQTYRVKQGETCLVGLYIDKSNRLSATMDVYKMLNSDSPYKVNDKVKGTIYNIKKEIGVFVAVDNQYQGLIPYKELFGNYRRGDKIEARVRQVREDGKLNLSFRDKGKVQMDEDAAVIFEKMSLNNGILLLNDNSDPERIKTELNMSKRAFKRAVGRLFKEKKIKFTEEGIELNRD